MSDLPVAALCRDCLGRFAGAPARCPACGSPRIVARPELFQLAIAHVDCDAFYAAVEKRDRPELTDQPVIVGGGVRGVVATACYVARTFGVRSAMPMFKALKACPHAVVIAPNMAKYSSVAREVRARMEAITPLIEPLSIDEAFLDLTGTERLHGLPPALVLARLQRDVERQIGITLSVGLSHNKFLAKVASDMEKPRGFTVIGRAEAQSFLAGQPVSLVWGVGRAMQARLARDGISTIGQLQRAEPRKLIERYGTIGFRLARLAQGDDAREVVAARGAKSISAETTFDHDIGDAADLLPRLRELSEKVSSRLKAQNLSGRTVVLKLKTSAFELRTRNVRLEWPTNLADRIYGAGRALLMKELDGTLFRLVGIGMTGLDASAGEEPADLADPNARKRASAEGAMDTIRARFGPDGLRLGLTFSGKRRGRNESA